MTPVLGPKNRLPHVDLLKSLAIWFVLIFHGTLYANAVYPTMPLSMLLRYFSRTILSTCVPLFFFVSGYLMLGRPLNLKKHSIRTGKMMVLTCFWILFLLVILQYYYQESIVWSELKEQIWELKDGWNNHLWYMNTLITIYLVYPLLKATFDGSRSSFFWFTGVMAILVFGSNLLNLAVTLFNLFVKQEFSLFYNNLPVFNHFNPFAFNTRMGIAYFCLGGTAWALEGHLRKIPARWRNLAAAVMIPVCCGMLGILGWRFSLYLKDLWDVVWNGYTTVFTLGNVLCLYVLSLNLKRDIPLLRWISANTLGIYLVHDLIHKLIGPVVSQFAPMRTLPGTLLYASGLLMLTLGVCLVLKKIPLVKHLVS